MSHLYLKHCEGRELGVDAATPRSDEVVDSEEEGFNPGESQAVLDSSQMLGASGVSQSMNGLTMTGMQSTNAFTGSVATRRRKKIERNKVLTDQAKATRESRVGQ